MRVHMIVISAALHVGLATGLLAVAQKREMRRRAISVAVTDEKKKEAKPKPPPPPKPIVHVAPKVVAAVPKAEVAPVSAPKAAPVAAAPVATSLAMSNDDAGPGIGLYGRAPAAKAAPAPAKVASAITERRTHRTEEQAAGEEPCNEEPTKPEAIFKTPLDYSLHPQAQADGVEGKFRARLTVAANGEVSNVEVQAGIEPAFDNALVAALKTWRFKPAMACGKPVNGGTFIVARTFELGD
jgi:protein TonB